MQTPPLKSTQSAIMTVRQAATYLGLAVSTLNKWRCHGGGPIFIKMGRAVRYRAEDLDAFMDGRRASSTTDFEARAEPRG